jgi:XTP/dITP diphosphohydrolase
MDQRGARYRCVIVYVANADDPAPLIGEGEWVGSLVPERRGTKGFGYDPSFVPAGDTRTVAEMPDEEKNRLSHRAKAAAAFLAQFGREGR